MIRQALRILFFVSLFIFGRCRIKAQPNVKSYDVQWKQVNTYLNKQLTKSALQEIRKIYQLAKKERQEAQIIKALVYIAGLQDQVAEDSQRKAILDIESEINTSREPSKSILYSVLAEMYWNYYQQHRWQLYDRTNTQSFKKDDIATWTADDLHEKIRELYLQSIKNLSALQQTRLEGYDAIITRGNVRHLRPTLFDLLAHNALEYFKNDERDITKPAYGFEIEQASAFDPAVDFISRKFITKDSVSLEYKALLIYQQLIGFHLNDPKPDALIDADLERIQFVNEKGVQPNKKELYLAALSHIAHQYENYPVATQASYLVAKQYSDNA